MTTKAPRIDPLRPISLIQPEEDPIFDLKVTLTDYIFWQKRQNFKIRKWTKFQQDRKAKGCENTYMIQRYTWQISKKKCDWQIDWHSDWLANPFRACFSHQKWRFLFGKIADRKLPKKDFLKSAWYALTREKQDQIGLSTEKQCSEIQNDR